VAGKVRKGVTHHDYVRAAGWATAVDAAEPQRSRSGRGGRAHCSGMLRCVLREYLSADAEGERIVRVC